MDEMLVLQRASAGSGKTFALAKNYLRYFLSIKVSEEGKKRRLRTFAELNDSLSHILAVTFTNKATNEMQQRIVERLYDLAFPDIFRERLKKRHKPERDPDYLKDFMEEFNVTERQLAAVCRRALSVMLNNYSEFQVSTIDSFFQLVLRTFAYESDLNDSYQIELDSKFLSRMGIDAILKDIDKGTAPEEVRYWIRELMERSRKAGGKWNIFQKRESNSPYASLLSAIGRIETEDFKQIRSDIERYFENGADFMGIYEDLKKRYDTLPLKPYLDMQQKADELLETIGSDDDKLSSSAAAHARKCLNCAFDRQPKASAESFAIMEPDKFEKKTFANIIKTDPEHFGAVRDRYLEMASARREWLDVLGSREYLTWRLYSVNFPYLGLLRYSLEKRREYLMENNAVELAETNTLLRRIIGKENDTPFIYERLGTRLNHFLIDEFQDTSKLQWENIRPLLSESLSNNNENLIIGDAKQSIYRFRNADPSLIIHKVSDTFPSLDAKGDTPQENTNWRSDRHIVEFNNSLFRYLADSVTADSINEDSASAGRMDFRTLYSNVEQTPRHKEKQGYVEINILTKKPQKSIESDGMESTGMAALAPGIVAELRSHGYRMRDIAFLVRENSQGVELIKTFTEHNSRLDHNDPRKIEFISEQSLMVSSSEAVDLIVSTLATINRGIEPRIRQGEDRVRKGVADWNEIRCNFRLFALRNPGHSGPELLEEFYKKGTDFNAIEEILSDMQSTALPALVEAITAAFLPSEMRSRDAAYLASFQDLVLEYCESHPSDIASFLKWWERKKVTASITSPEETDAVRVMTIHKSKGLEFPCVVMLYCDSDFSDSDSHSEWRWVEPSGLDFGSHRMPDFIPVDTKKSLIGTAHENLFYEFVDMKHMDELNSLYVGFTRAVNELYIYSSRPSRKTGVPLADKLAGFISAGAEGSAPVFEPIEEPSAELSSIGSYERFSFGEKYDVAPSVDKGKGDSLSGENTEEKVNGKPGKEKIVNITEYDVHPTPDFLKYKEEDLPALVDADDYEEETKDPRSKGNLYHGMMQDVIHLEDMPRAARRLVIKGLVDRAKADEMAQTMEKAIESAGIREWFGKDYRVLNERTLLHRGSVTSRPDRIIIDKKGNVIVIDYKFGEVEREKKYGRQVCDYVETLKSTGCFQSVKGFLWYVFLGRLVFVCD